MTKRKVNKEEVLDENLDTNVEEVQDELSEEVSNDSKNDIQEPKEDNQVNQENKEESKEIINIGSRVKINPELSNDIVGRRIHSGLKNYVYTVKAVRPDGYATVECMTYVFTVAKSDLIPMMQF